MSSSRIFSQAARLGFLRRSSRVVQTRTQTLTRRRFGDMSKWAEHKLNTPYIFFDFAGTTGRRQRKFIPAIMRFLDDYIFRSNASYFTFIILGAFCYESLWERLVDGYWYRVNRDRLFTPEVLDRFPPVADEEADDDFDEDW